MAPRVSGLLILCALLLSGQDRPPARQDDDDDHQAERLQWFYSQRMYPNGTIPAGARRNAILEINRIDAAARARRQAARSETQGRLPFALTTDASNWKSIGPRPTNPTGNNVTSGRISAIAVDPRDNNVVYLGAAEGGVWKTTDGGANWTPLTDDQPSLASGSIALDPQNPDIVYVGTGEENFAFDNYYGAGILKSTDGGRTWTNLPGTFLRDAIGSLGVHPTDSNILVCASQRGIWQSSDAGNSWTLTLAGAAGTAAFFDPSNGDSVWAALGTVTGNSRNGVYHSTDAGLTWTQVTGTGTTGSLPSTGVGRIALAMAPSSPATMYAQVAGPRTTVNGVATALLLGIYKTTDAGLTWTRLNPGVFASSLGSQLWYYNVIRISPTDPNLVWAGGLGLIRSRDGGITWDSPPQVGANRTQIHVDFHYLAFTADGSKLYLGNDGGMYSTVNAGAAASQINWTSLNYTLALTQFYPGMSMDPGTSGVLIAGAQDNGTQLFDGGSAWNNVTCGDGGFTLMDPSFPDLAFGACQNIDIRRVVGLNSGATWAQTIFGIDQTDATSFISPMAMDPSNPQTLYFGTYRLWQSQDSGGAWAAASPDLTGGNRGTLETIAIAPSDPNTVYIGTSNARVQATGDALKGAGASWSDRSAGLPARSVTHIAVDPIDASTAYVTFSGFPSPLDLPGHVYKTTNRGATWTDISGNLPSIPVNDILPDPDVPNTLYLGTDAGVMISTDGGNSWSSLGNGLPRVVVMSLAMGRKTRVLRAATHGRSVWEIAIPLSAPSLQPQIDTLTPATVDEGSGNVVLTVAGSNFVPGTVVRWNGQNRKTTFSDVGHVTVQITAEDVALVGRAILVAFNGATGGGLSNSKNFNIGGAPQTNAAALVNAANPKGGNFVAPRSIASLYGVNLAPSVIVAGGGALPILLGGTALVNGTILMPLFFVSPGQINMQVPNSGVTGTLPLTVSQGIRSVTIQATIRQFAPGLFAMNGQGTGQAATVIANTGILVAPEGTTADSRPAKAGEFLSIYCTGLGLTSNAPALGQPTASSPLSTTALTPVVTIGGVNAKVIFSGLAPGFVGLNQVNVQVPDGVAPGDAVPVVLTIGGVTSNTVTIAIAAQ